MSAITWVGHATVLIELDGVRLLTDPVLEGRVGPLVRIVPPVDRSRLERLDGVLISHLHSDHTHLASLRSVADGQPVLAPPGAGDWLVRHGVSGARELRPGEATEIGAVRVEATEADHDHRRHPLGPEAEPIGFVVSGSRSVYFPGDTDLFDTMGELRGTVDVALLPVWGWGPTLGPGHLDPERAARAAALIAPALAIPIHWGTLALSRPAPRSSDPARPAREFAELAARYAPEVEVRVLAPGERTEL